MKRTLKIGLALVVTLGVAYFVIANLFTTRAISSVHSELGQSITLSPNDFLVNEPKDTQASFITDLSKVDIHSLGTTEIQILVGDKIYTSSIKVVDTIAPVAIVEGTSVEVNGTLDPESLISSIIDQSDTTVSFKTNPTFDEAKTIEVIVIVKDTSGNKSEYPVSIEVVFDKTAPSIIELDPLYITIGSSSVDYWAHTSVTDEKSTIASTTVLSDQVNLNKLGSYPITLTATDSSGNVSSIQRLVKVVKESTYLTMEALYDPTHNKSDPFIEAVLSEIITENMTQREKMQAIYDWFLKDVVYQAETSHEYATDTYNKIDPYAEAGFTKLKGNCFHFAAMAAELLNALDLELTLVKGEGYSATAETHFMLHYWVMVNIDGQYYHFDPLFEYLYSKYGVHKNFFLVSSASVYNITLRWEASLYPTNP